MVESGTSLLLFTQALLALLIVIIMFLTIIGLHHYKVCKRVEEEEDPNMNTALITDDQAQEPLHASV